MTASRVGKFINDRKLAVTWLKSELSGVKVVTRVPTDLTAALPLVWVATLPGAGDYDVSTYRWDLHSFAASEDAMWTLTGQVQDAMRALGRNEVGGQLTYATRSVGTPADIFWSTNVWRSVATYEVDVPTLV